LNPLDLVVSRLNLNHGKYCIFAGAGISVCSGVPLAVTDLPGLPSVVTCIRRDFYASLKRSPLAGDALLRWYSDQKLLQEAETLYSDALQLIGDTPRSRQAYLRKFFTGKTPGVCHMAVGALVEHGHVQILFTTNFDSLLEDAIRGNGKCDPPKVASHADSVRDVILNEPGPKVIKLHGDYLFSDIRNTDKETRSLTDNMREKLRRILGEFGLIVVGYSGNDNSVMAILEQMAFDGGYFPFGLYWLHLGHSIPRPRVLQFLKDVGGCPLAIDSAEAFLDALVHRVRGSA
jgi:hypothetical protein